MNEANQELFRRYGHYEEYATQQFYISAHDPAAVFKLEEIARYDKSARESIEQLENYVSMLKAYRMELAKRYNELSTAPVEKVVKLIRDRRCYGDTRVYYYLSTYDRIDGKDVQTSNVTYSGSDRRTAISDFEKYKKDHPGIIFEIDIEKKRWEK